MRRLLQFGIAIKRGGASLQDRMDKEKKPYIFVGLVCVREKYQGQGYLKNRFETAPSFSLFIQQFRIRQCGVKTALNGGYGASI